MKTLNKIKNYFIKKWTGYTFEQLCDLKKSNYYVEKTYRPIVLRSEKVVYDEDTRIFTPYIDAWIKKDILEHAKEYIKISEKADPAKMLKTYTGELILQVKE